MKKKFFLIPLLVTALGSIWFGPLMGFSIGSTDHPNSTLAGDSGWNLLVYGSAQDPLSLTFSELVSMPRTTVYAELNCEGAPVDRGYWVGVRLGFLLEKAGLGEQTRSVQFYATDGYSTMLPLSTAIREDVIIAYEKDGNLLSETTRLIIPNANGSEWISMIAQIKTVNT